MLPWKRSPWADAALLCEQINPDNVPVDAAGRNPRDWFASLRERARHHDALTFLAHALPRYESVVWAAQVLLEIGAADRLDPIMVAVLRWIDQPGDGLRREAGELAERARRDTPARLLGLAVLFSGGSIAPADYAPILPTPGACSAMIGAAIMSGIGVGPDDQYRRRLDLALERGTAIAQGD